MLLFIAVLTVSVLQAQNPISPPGLYLSDPSARIFRVVDCTFIPHRMKAVTTTVPGGTLY